MCLIQTATLTAGLTLTATYTPKADHIAVHVELQDTAGQDRALEVIVALPVDANGWHWWDDVRHSRLITVGSAVASPPPEYPLPSCLSWTYEHVVSGVWDGWLPISLYSYALIEDGSHGLALAASLDSPRLVKLAYDQEQQRYEARGYLGISPLGTELASRADLSLELYRVEPAWGFRGAMDRFAAWHPAWFESSRLMYDYNGYERSYYMTEAGAQQVLAYDQEGIFAAQYIVAEAPLKDGPVSEPLPTYEETIELVEELDGFGGEGGSKTKAHQNWNPRILDYRRAIAYHKPQAWANGEPDLTLDDVEEFVDLALFYGILPTRKDEATGWEHSSDQLITDTQQVLFQFWIAGWEPVTHAWAYNNDVWVERFGGGFQVRGFALRLSPKGSKLITRNPKPRTRNSISPSTTLSPRPCPSPWRWTQRRWGSQSRRS